MSKNTNTIMMRQKQFHLLLAIGLLAFTSAAMSCSNDDSENAMESEKSEKADTAATDTSTFIHMLDGNVKWSYSYHSALGSGMRSVSYGTDGTLENGGKTYHKVYRKSDADQSFSAISVILGGLSDGAYVLGLREENGRVLVNYDEYISYLKRIDNEHTEAYYKQMAEQYGLDIKLKEGTTWETDNWVEGGDVNYIPYPLTDDGEMVLYDFTMQVGDKFRSVAGHDDIGVVQVDTITTSGNVERRKLTLSNGLVLIEGIGCINSPSRLFTYLNPLPRNSQSINEFRAYYVNEECMYNANSMQ